MLVGGCSSTHRSLVRESPGSFQATLNGHETKLEREVVRVNRAETEQAALFEEEESMSAQLRQRRWTRWRTQQKRTEVVSRRTHACILMVHDPDALLRIDHQVRRVIIAMAKDARHGCELGGDVVQLSLQLRDFSMSQGLATQASEVVFEKEVELPRQFRFIKGETARD